MTNKHNDRVAEIEDTINKFWNDWECPSNDVYTKELALALAASEAKRTERIVGALETTVAYLESHGFSDNFYLKTIYDKAKAALEDKTGTGEG